MSKESETSLYRQYLDNGGHTKLQNTDYELAGAVYAYTLAVAGNYKGDITESLEKIRRILAKNLEEGHAPGTIEELEQLIGIKLNLPGA